MSVAATSSYPSVIAGILSGSQWLPPASIAVAPAPAGENVFQFNIGFPEIGVSFWTELSQVETNADYTVVTAGAFIDPGAMIFITLHNEITDGAGNLTIKNISINFSVSQHRPRAHFMASSLYATLALAGPVHILIPSLNVDLQTSFFMPLPEVSRLLQSRQTYYGLMVIEHAAELEFDISDFITGEDVSNISFSYHAIVQREFIWLMDFFALTVPASDESLEWIDSLSPIEPGGNIYRLSFGPGPEVRMILGKPVELGPQTIFIEDGDFRDFENVRRGIAQLDGHIVPVVIRPISGLGRYIFSAPPQPPSSWDDKIMLCLSLEQQLNQRLAAQYNALAASTLDGLTPEEIESITSHTDEDAFLLADE
jgi:hypothetical protein